MKTVAVSIGFLEDVKNLLENYRTCRQISSIEIDECKDKEDLIKEMIGHLMMKPETCYLCTLPGSCAKGHLGECLSGWDCVHKKIKKLGKE